MSLTTFLLGTWVPIINAQELEENLEDGNCPFLLDVRQPQEYPLGHIPGAKLIHLESLSRHLSEIPKNREIACIRAMGHRSVPAVNKTIEVGVEARSLKNGMIAWQMAEQPIKKEWRNKRPAK